MDWTKKFKEEIESRENLKGTKAWNEFWVNYDSMLEKAYLRTSVYLDDDGMKFAEKMFIKSLRYLSTSCLSLAIEMESKIIESGDLDNQEES